jgi:hypothetical protein
VALADTAKLVVDLSLAGNFSRNLSTAQRSLGRFDAALSKTEGRAFRAGQQIGTGIKRGATLAAAGVGLIAFEVFQGLDSLVELEKQQKQTTAAIKSTGGAAGITAQQVRDLAEKYEALNATVGDETIQQAENLLLTFTNIRKKAFEPTLQAALDINTRLGRGPEGLTATMRQLGKALNDPTKGLSALTRIGITFDKKTTARIKKLQKEGKLYEAQGVILKELERRFGGSFEAEGGTVGGRVAKFKDAIEDLQRTLASGLLPVVGNIADALSELFADKEVQKGVEKFGKDLAALFTKDRIKSGIAAIRDVFTTIKAIAGPAAAAVKLMVDAFAKLPPDLRNLLIGAIAVNKLTGGLVTNIAGGLASALSGALKTIYASHVTVIGPGGTSVPGATPAPGKGGVGGALKGLAGLLVVGIVAEVASVIGPEISGLGAKLGQGWRDWLASQTGIRVPTIDINQLQWPFGPKNTPRILPEVFGGNGLLGGTPPSPNGGRHPGVTPVKVGAIEAAQQKTTDAVNRMKESMADEIFGMNQGIDTVATRAGELKIGFDQIEDRRSADATAAKTSIDNTKTAVDNTKLKIGTEGAITRTRIGSASSTNAAVISGATRQGSAAIVAAIYAARPIVNVTQVTRNTTIQQRYGNSNGSSGSDHGGSIGFGGGD